MIIDLNSGSTADLLDSLFEGVYIVDRERRIVYWNTGAEIITGFKRKEITGKRCADNILKHVDDLGRELCTTGCPLALVISGASHNEMKIYLHHKDGHRVPVRVRIQPVYDNQGKINGAIEFFTEISHDRSILTELEKVKKEVYRDHLTGIGNRKYGELYLDRLYEHFRLYDSRFGVLYIDIDNFKEVNDRYGHEAGDQVLRMAANTIRNSLRSFDILFRNGGDEFVALLPLCNDEVLGQIAERIRVLVESSFLDLGRGKTLKITVSIGTVLSFPGCTKKSLINKADQKMYISKNNGRNRVS